MSEDKSIFERAGVEVPQDISIEVTDVIPTGILPLDMILGIGGFARGRMASIIGIPSIGKSTITVNLARINALQGGTTIIFDTEETYEPYRMNMLGVTPELMKKIIVINHWGLNPKTKEINMLTVESVHQWIVKLLKVAKRSDKLLIILDTISGLATEVETDLSKDHEKYMGKHSRELSYFYRLLPSLIAASNATFIVVAQPKVDPMNMGAQTYLGEKPIKFHSSQIINLQKYSQDPNRIVSKATITKNKLATAYKSAMLNFYIDIGMFDAISNIPELVKGNGYAFNKTTTRSRKDFNKLLKAEKQGLEEFVMSKLERKFQYHIYPYDTDIELTDIEEGEAEKVEEVTESDKTTQDKLKALKDLIDANDNTN